MATRRNRHARSASDILKSLVVALLLGAATTVHAQSITLDFEGLQNQEYVQEFYSGGTGSASSSGTDYGVDFGATALATINEGGGGNEDFANEPSPVTALVFYDSNVPTQGGYITTSMNVVAGFSELLSFYHSSRFSITVSIYSEVDGGGAQLATTTVGGQNTADGCTDADYCNWTQVNLPFNGIARSVTFYSQNNVTLIDNLSLGASGGQVAPIPSLSFLATLLLATTLGALTLASKRRRSA